MTEQLTAPGVAAPAGFPHCSRCAYLASGPVSVCAACARALISATASASCPACAQRLRQDGRCPNELCRSPARRIGRIRALGYQEGALRRAIISHKYRGARSMSMVLGRLLLAFLDGNVAADPPDLIVANPGFAGPDGQRFGHAEAVLAAAAQADTAGRWPFDIGSPPAIVKVLPTLKSAETPAWSKRSIRYELRDALRIPEPDRTRGKYVLVYDDICTTGTQLDVVAGCLLDEGGAARVEAVVLARAPWRG
ncbi:MAG TPA: hypothetical protein VGI58_15520 [Streptosporangiaceae bacterium]|jgi:predicted amidophosphoribosyltransferase